MQVVIESHKFLEAKSPPIVTVEASEVESKTGFTSGCEVAEVHVMNDKGLTAKFFVQVRIKNGRPEAELTAMKNSSETRKKAVADWRL